MEKINLALPAFTWWTVFAIVGLGIAEFYLSWLSHKINIFVIARRRLEATKLDLIANTIAEIMPFFVYVIDPNILYIVPKILANSLGTWVVASRKLECPICGEIVATEINHDGSYVYYNLYTGDTHKCKKPTKPRIYRKKIPITTA